MLTIIDEPQNLAHQKVNAVLTSQNGEGNAQCSLWWKNVPNLKHHQLGLIGHYGTDSIEAGTALITHACEILAARGCTMAIGPMDGNTWNRYRLITERGTHPPFFLEPENSEDVPQHFAANGFSILAEYFSTITNDLQLRNPRMEIVADEIKLLGVKIRAFKP
jgi:hypothetical protein